MGSADNSITTIVARRLPRRAPWADEAPCAGRWWMTDIPPELRHNTNRTTIVAAMQPGLALCAGCPFAAECTATVAPRESFYDGVCGGLVYRNGRPIGGLASVATTTEDAA